LWWHQLAARDKLSPSALALLASPCSSLIGVELFATRARLASRKIVRTREQQFVVWAPVVVIGWIFELVVRLGAGEPASVTPCFHVAPLAS